MFHSTLKYGIIFNTIAIDLKELYKSEKTYTLSKISERDYLLTYLDLSSVPNKLLAIDSNSKYSNANYLQLEIIKTDKNIDRNNPQSFVLLLSIEELIKENFSTLDNLLDAVDKCKENQILNLVLRKFVDDFDLNFEHYIQKEHYLEIWGGNLKHSFINILLKLVRDNSISFNYETKKLEELRQYLATNIYRTPPTIEKMAYMVEMSPSKFKNYFKKYTGYSPHQYILTVRLTKAFELLSTGEFSISQVAYKVGFHHPASFSRFFKQKFYCSPSEITQNKLAS